MTGSRCTCQWDARSPRGSFPGVRLLARQGVEFEYQVDEGRGFLLVQAGERLAEPFHGEFLDLEGIDASFGGDPFDELTLLWRALPAALLHAHHVGRLAGVCCRS